MPICHLHYEAAPCKQCAAGVLTRGSDRLRLPSIITFKETTFENIYDPWERPRPIDNPETLRQECAKRGVTSHYLRDSLLWRSGERRWV